MTDTERTAIQDLSTRMWSRFHNPRSLEDAIRCGLIHQNCQRILAGDESPEIVRVLARNVSELEAATQQPRRD